MKDYEENVADCGPEENCSYTALQVFKAIVDFFGIFGASFLVGTIMGSLTALITKFTHIK